MENHEKTIGKPKALVALMITGWWFGTMEIYDFPYIGNVIIPIDFHLFSEGLKPPTSISYNQICGRFLEWGYPQIIFFFENRNGFSTTNRPCLGLPDDLGNLHM